MSANDSRAFPSRLFNCFRSVLIGAVLYGGQPMSGTTLIIATHYTNEQRAPLTSCFAEYERLNPNIAIVHRQLSYRDFLQTFFMARLGGARPDIYNLASMWTAQLVGSSSLAEPPPDIAEFVKQQYLPKTRQAIATEGHVWGVPAEIAVYMLVYNRLLLANAGFSEPPATWDDLLRAARSISRVNRQGQLTVSGFAFGPNPAMVVNPFIALLYSRGQSLFSPDRLSTSLDTADALAVLTGEVELFKSRGTTLGAAPAQFPSGTVGMMIVPNWYKRVFQQSLGDDFSRKVGVAPIPAGPDWRTVQYGFFWAVDKNSGNQREAWKLLRWLNSPQAPGRRSCMGEMLIQLGALTGNRSDLTASAAELAHPFMKPFVDALSSGRALPLESVLHANEVEELLRSYIEEAWLQMRSPEQALREADKNILRILRESPKKGE